MTELVQAEIDRLLDNGRTSTHSVEIASTLAPLAKENDSPAGRALLWAFQQQLQLGDHGKLLMPFWKDRYGGGETKMPPEHREALLLAVASPRASIFVRGHLGSLLWRIAPGRDVLAVADAAIDALLEIGTDTTIQPMERYGHLVAAVDLAKRRKDDARFASTLHALLALADEVLGLGTDDQQPGTLMLTIEHYLLLGGDDVQAIPRLEAAITTFAGHSHARQDIAAMLVSLVGTPEARAAVAGDEIARLIADAASQSGFLRETTLRRALTLARQSGQRVQAGEVSTLLAAISPDEYDFKVFEHDFTIPGDEVRAVLAPFQPGQDPHRGFARLGLLIPKFLPADQRPERPLSVADLLATPVNISSHGHAEYSPSTEAQRATYRSRQEDMMEFQVHYNFILQGLRDMLARPDALAEFRDKIDSSALLSDKGKRRAHKALDAYIAEDWDSVADTLPTIEAAIRTLCLGSGINIYAPAGDANEFKALGGLLLDLETLGDDDMRRMAEYWRFALTDTLGLNIRNNYLHGLEEDATQMHATVIMQIYTQLITFVTSDNESDDDAAE